MLSVECTEKLTTSRDYAIHVQATKYDTLGNSYCKYTIKAVHDVSAIKPANDCQAQQPVKKLKTGQGSIDASTSTTIETSVTTPEDAAPKFLRSMKKKSE